MHSELIERISLRLDESLPGVDSHDVMSPVKVSNYRMATKAYLEAAVIALLFPKNGETNVLFMKRSSNDPRDKHAGQISFPGGKKESSDKTILMTAHREMEEEVGVNNNQYKVLGSLSPLYVYVSNFLVQPFIAYSEEELIFIPEEKEVEKILEIPLKCFLEYRNRKFRDIHIRGNILKNVPYFDVDGEVLWGATSMIMSELIAIFTELKINENSLKSNI